MTKVGPGAEEEREHRKGFYGGLATLYSWQPLSRSSLAANEARSEKLAAMTGNMGWGMVDWENVPVRSFCLQNCQGRSEVRLRRIKVANNNRLMAPWESRFLHP
jgi:hypothetical protein